MPAKHELSPRKRPRQERGRATVEAILQAATYILIKSGWEALNTNAVAERAGVNISSLYQYFPNKESIVSELRNRHQERINACSAPSAGETMHERIVAAIRHGIEIYRDNAELFRAFEEVPRSRRRLVAGRRERADRPLLPEGQASLTQSSSELTTFVARTAVEAVLREVTLSQPKLLSDPRLVDELALLLENYLVRTTV
jgi:AcrR family transcriptional regulator